MKKSLAIMLAVALGLLCGCSGSNVTDSEASNSSATVSEASSSVEAESEAEGEDEAEESSSEREELNAEVKDATDITIAANAEVYELLDFSDETEREFAERGLIDAPESLVITSEDGTVLWSQDVYDFIDEEAADTVNPSLWRNTQLNSLYGLFEVVDGIYQVRGYDISNITFIRSDSGWIIFDCGTTVETASAALELFEKNFGEAHIAAIVISHAHTDHYNGIAGLISEEDVADASLSLEDQIASGKTAIIVPDGFEEAVMEENVFAGSAMRRRAIYQYGSLLETSVQGKLSVGIGIGLPSGTGSYYSPTFVVTEEIFETTIDGVAMTFQLTPGTECPAEMNTWLPDYKALWMAENCTGTMHNLYTLRGAEVRDANDWAQYIMEARELFGAEAEVVFQSHNWPHWGNDVVNEYMLNTAAVYKYIFSQTLMYINEGYTSTEIANMIELPDDLAKVWYTRQYYGTLSHNVKAVYQKYMGWYDANPVNLDELAPTEYALKLVEYLGDTDAVLEMARDDFEKGEYQWVAQITNILVYADPDNMEARYLCADALEQLGYQAESGAWRNAYLTGAYELRYGTDAYSDVTATAGSASTGMSTEIMFDYLAICLDAKAMEDENLVINVAVTDEDAYYVLRVNSGVLLYSQEDWVDDADATIYLKRLGILGIARNNQQLMDAYIESVEGDSDIIELLTGYIAEFPAYFNIVEP
ncbi:MAG: MBL fold metallo-hydrolase [Clostridiales bacterium]|nr:MBL fold metallo-hydrolase [Clostridiales bacterium]